MELDFGQAVDCYCWIYIKIGAWHARVAPDKFKVIQGENHLTLYPFNGVNSSEQSSEEFTPNAVEHFITKEVACVLSINTAFDI